MNQPRMGWNKEGQWHATNPLQTYKERVRMSEQHPGSGGALWTSEERHKIHNEATKYVMGLRGIPDTVENFDRVRAEIGREVEEDYNHNERNGFTRINLQPVTPSPLYGKLGD